MFYLFKMPKRMAFGHFLASSENELFFIKKEDMSSKKRTYGNPRWQGYNSNLIFAELILKEAEHINKNFRYKSPSSQVTAAISSSNDASKKLLSPPTETTTLLNKYKRRKLPSNDCSIPTARQKLSKYLDTVNEMNHQENVFDFWQKKSCDFPTLFRLAFCVLSVPATSAPVERVFSKSGFILRPQRSSTSSENFSMQVFLKCNPDSLFY